MEEKPTTAKGYSSDQAALVRSACLYMATKLGDIMDELVVVGGLVPSLLIDQNSLPEGVSPHVGTMDLDIGLTLGLLDSKRYKTLTERLRAAGLSQDINEQGHPTRQRWKIKGKQNITVDFLIPPSLPNDRGGKIRHIEPDFAAVIAPGLHLAFADREQIAISGPTIMGEQATRNVWACGAGAYVVLKALAFDFRGENKDAYDLFYLVRNYGMGAEDVAAKLRPHLKDDSTQKALQILRRDFTDPEATGPRRVAEFISGFPDSNIQADVVGYVMRFLESCRL